MKNKEVLQDDDFGDVSELDKIFSSETGNTQGDAKELFSIEKIMGKTDLSPHQISCVDRAYFLFELCELPEGKKLLDNFLILRLSKNRESRKEFVEGLKAKLENAQNQLAQLQKGFGK